MKKISKEEINELPLLRFEHDIYLIDQKEALREACQDLSKVDVLGFDTESKPVFRKGQYNPVALVQLATDREAFLFRVSHTGLLPELKALLSDDNILKIGVSIRDDIKDLQKLARFNPAGFISLEEITQEMNIANSGVRGLGALFLGGRISKAQQTSNWEAERLSEAQLNYAATDAWVCLKVYQKVIMQKNQ